MPKSEIHKSKAVLSSDFKPLSKNERGRGRRIGSDRKKEILDECLRLIRLGVSQDEIVKLMGGTRARVSRWCREAVSNGGVKRDRSRLKYHDKTLLQSIWMRIDTSGDCWRWVGNIKNNGYGTLNYKGRTVHVHREIYRLFIGPIPEGMVIDHICNNPACCNPDHLHCVTQNENIYFAKVRENA